MLGINLTFDKLDDNREGCAESRLARTINVAGRSDQWRSR
jgi:hypothetical protein